MADLGMDQPSSLEEMLQYQLEHVPTPGPPDYAPETTRVGGGLLGDSEAYSFRGDSFPRPFIETALKGELRRLRGNAVPPSRVTATLIAACSV
eukprot:SAG31_NODE_1248_length_9126_cov_5.023928_4_plen_93_part_00